MLREILYRLIAAISLDRSSPCNVDFAGYAGTGLFDGVYNMMNFDLKKPINVHHNIIRDLHCNCS